MPSVRPIAVVAPLATSRELLGEWDVEQKKVSLWSTGRGWEVTSEHEAKANTFRSLIDDPSLARLFHSTVGRNLTQTTPHRFPRIDLEGNSKANTSLYHSCFVPKLLKEAPDRSGSKVAIFYHLETKSDNTQEFKGIGWGLHTAPQNECLSFGIQDDSNRSQLKLGEDNVPIKISLRRRIRDGSHFA